jgi:hypothetical protein
LQKNVPGNVTALSKGIAGGFPQKTLSISKSKGSEIINKIESQNVPMAGIGWESLLFCGDKIMSSDRNKPQYTWIWFTIRLFIVWPLPVALYKAFEMERGFGKESEW